MIYGDRDDLIWLAGLLEGEGTFDLHKGRYARIRISMTDRDVLGRAAHLMGGRVRMTLHAPGLKPMFHTEVTGTRAEGIMRELLPYMGARRSAKIGEILGHLAWRRGDIQARSVPGPSLTRPPGIPEPTSKVA